MMVREGDGMDVISFEAGKPGNRFLNSLKIMRSWTKVAVGLAAGGMSTENMKNLNQRE